MLEKGTSPTCSLQVLIGAVILCREVRYVNVSLTDEAVPSHCQQISLRLYASARVRGDADLRHCNHHREKWMSPPNDETFSRGLDNLHLASETPSLITTTQCMQIPLTCTHTRHFVFITHSLIFTSEPLHVAACTRSSTRTRAEAPLRHKDATTLTSSLDALL